MDGLGRIVLSGRYEVEREIGRGGMASVWLARDARHQRLVAIKILDPDLAGEIGIDRFLREIRLTAGLQHPSIVPILDSGILERTGSPSVPWFAMPYLDGESLRARLHRERQLSIEESLRIAGAVGSALAAAHGQHVVHRDIKPENVFLVGDQVYVVDFGIATALGGMHAERLTRTGLAIGTAAYMSPEQAAAEPVDARSDQYSLATILYEMIAGEPPFTGPTAQAVIARRLGEPARPLTTVRPTVPASLERAILRGLQRVPADRFASVTEFVAALRAPEVPPPLARRASPMRVAVTAAALIAAAGLAAWPLLSRRTAARAHAAHPEVVALHRRGMQAYDRRSPAGNTEAIVSLRDALRRDSSFAPAWNALAKAYTRAYQRAFRVPDVPAEQLLQVAVRAVDRSLALDSTSADAWLTRSMLSEQIDPTDLGPPLRDIRRSIALDPTQAPPWHQFALYLAEKGDLDSAFAAWRHCVRLGPAYTQGVAFLALAHYWRRNFDSAAVWADSAMRLDPNYLMARDLAGSVAMERGDYARADAAFQAIRRLSTDVEVVNALISGAQVKARSGRAGDARVAVQRAESLAVSYRPLPLHTVVELAKAHFALGNADRALDVLAEYQPARDLHFQLHVRCDPMLGPLSSDRRFRALLLIAPPDSGKGC